MTPGARVQAAIEILDQILEGAPAEKALTGWARRSRFAGSKDRAAVRDHVFDALRRRNAAVFYGGAMTGRGVMIGVLRQEGADLEALFSGGGYAPAALQDGEVPDATGTAPYDMPEWLIAPLRDSLGGDFEATAAALTQRAPVILRVNLQRGTRPMAQDTLKAEGIETVPMDLVETALRVTEGARKVKQSKAYLEGLVELQDASSQAFAAKISLSKTMKVLDFCAGGGGKTLAMAGRAEARFYAYDALAHRMADLPARAQRAGATIQIVETPQDHAPFDVVVCDVPCSGSGTWRRTPDAKWRFSNADLSGLLETQAEILNQASALVAEGGRLVYATCSLLKSENQNQIAAFVARHPEWSVSWQRQYTFAEGGDGFFAAEVLRA